MEAFRFLPRRIYLDTSTLQTIFDNGEVIWEGEPFRPSAKAARMPGMAKEVEALRLIFMVNERAGFEFVVTAANLRGVVNWDRRRYTQWVRDVEDTWLIQSAGAEEPPKSEIFDEPRFGNISSNDRRFLQSALDWRCDASLTMERRLPTQAFYIERVTGLDCG